MKDKKKKKCFCLALFVTVFPLNPSPAQTLKVVKSGPSDVVTQSRTRQAVLFRAGG